MRKSTASLLFVSVLAINGLLAQSKTAPPKVLFPARNGAVTFDHSAHAKREKNTCAACHPKLFAQDAKTPLAFKPPHKSAEDKKASCGACHRTDGAAFETKGNCTKCHVKAGAKQD